MSLPVYVVHYEAPEWCRQTVRSLIRSDCSVEITVVNNGGDLADLGVRVVDMAENVGYTGAANWALRDSRDSPFTVITSHDLEIQNDTLQALMTAAQVHPQAGVLGANVGSCGGLLGRTGNVEWREWTSGTCLLLRRECLSDIGDFDERLHSYGDDVDLGLRANRAGWGVGRVLDATADHMGSAIGAARRERLIVANQLLLAYKHHGWPRFVVAVSLGLLRRVGYQLREALRSPTHVRDGLWVACNTGAGAALALKRLATFRQR